MLVATDKEKERQKAAEASAPAIAGQVVLGGDSRIVIEPGDETVCGLLHPRDHEHGARAGESADAVRVRHAEGQRRHDGAAGIVAAGERPAAVTCRVGGPFPSGKTHGADRRVDCRSPSGTVEHRADVSGDARAAGRDREEGRRHEAVVAADSSASRTRPSKGRR